MLKYRNQMCFVQMNITKISRIISYPKLHYIFSIYFGQYTCIYTPWILTSYNLIQQYTYKVSHG